MYETLSSIIVKETQAAVQDAVEKHGKDGGCAVWMEEIGKDVMQRISLHVAVHNNDITMARKASAYAARYGRPAWYGGERLKVPVRMSIAQVADVLRGCVEIYVAPADERHKAGVPMAIMYGRPDPDPRLLQDMAEALDYVTGTKNMKGILTRLCMVCPPMPEEYVKMLQDGCDKEG